MTPRELFLLSPHHLPAKDSSYLGDGDVMAFLNGYLALWHPRALRGAVEPPRIASAYDHETPSAGHLYAVAESPELFLADDWDQRVVNVGARAFRAGSERSATLANLMHALREPRGENGAAALDAEPGAALLESLADEQVRPFFGIGLGYMHLGALFEAMDHENLVPAAEFWQDMQQAVEALVRADAGACRQHLQSAADKLMTARESLYPVAVHVVDIGLLEDYLNKPLEPPAVAEQTALESRPTAGWNKPLELPAAFSEGVPFNLVASGSVLETLAREHPDSLPALRARVEAEQVEVCVGAYREREDALFPLESQWWNLLKGLAMAGAILGSPVRVFARKRLHVHPQLPVLLTGAGLERALLINLDEDSHASSFSFRSTSVHWPSPHGKHLDGFTRAPLHADSPQTFFHLAHYLHQTIAQDSTATLALLHRGKTELPWYGDWLELTRLAPVLGKWTTLTGYFNDMMTGEHLSPPSPDEFHADYLVERTEAHVDRPVSAFARHSRLRRRVDTLWSLAGLQRGLAGKNDPLRLDQQLAKIEDACETGAETAGELEKIQRELMESLANRLLSRAARDAPGLLVLNPCSFSRRVALELEGVHGPLPIAGPLKACQLDGGQARLVVEVPALGFAWVPSQGPPGTATQALRMRLADERRLRNEFFEAEIDPASGGLRGIWDHRTRASRLGQQLVYNPGSSARVRQVAVTSTGPALGEIVTEGDLIDPYDKVLATFRQRFRAWLGRPLLELRIEIFPEHPPEGYPWHAYYGARFAWRDERALLYRGVHGASQLTSHTRPQSPDYVEWRLGRQCTALFPGGLPFQQRHGSRMLDVVLIPEGETGTAFDLAIGLDRDYPMQTALGLITPVPWIPVAKGPPHVGDTGWLFHLDAPNLLLTGLRPAAGGADAVDARMLECASHPGQAELRCVRNPAHAVTTDARGEFLSDALIHGDAVTFDVTPGDFMQLRVEFDRNLRDSG